ncbi:MAG TPA: alkyl sulfatase C-terminal domain-containing protein [Spirillospora sp.]|nr:alkyl sulfatase C-terminal domain-containing protein [Spirillospora sp.]
MPVATVSSGTGDRRADVTVRTDSSTLAAIAAGRLDIAEAIATGRIEAEGKEAALATLLDLLQAGLGGARPGQRSGRP